LQLVVKNDSVPRVTKHSLNTHDIEPRQSAVFSHGSAQAPVVSTHREFFPHTTVAPGTVAHVPRKQASPTALSHRPSMQLCVAHWLFAEQDSPPIRLRSR
jgi:hypothetical protein